ncbi:MAG: MFS transporter [Candidatus Eremiobacteraeota bacterium]|nr:MFS transporter [Candidatus Eremiobacteraeota bacterium]MBC5803936.1 MFS transporter [Candidatus Eremiobacteraeota bacterium]MBC5822344.1 MFS transporter [Candidatus Eremiobacteraeota bacterium]
MIRPSSIFGMGAMVGPAIGPSLGGWIVDNFSWRLIFFINVPIGILAFMMTLAFIRDPAYIQKPGRGADVISRSCRARSRLRSRCRSRDD